MCDFIRRPYTTKCRFFKDDDTEVDISWYPCKPDAPVLGVESVFVSLDWWVQERELGVYTGYDVGEVPLAARTYNGLKVKPNANGLHRCGTDEEWRDGAEFDPFLNRPRRADGLPTCCGEMPVGVVVGGFMAAPPVNGGPIVTGRSVVFLCGTLYGGGDIYDHTTHGAYVGFRSEPGFSVDWLMMSNIIPGNTYRFRLWAPTDVTFVRVGGGGLFGGGAWFHDFTPTSAGYFEWDQTIPASLFTLAYWELFKPDFGSRGYVCSVEQL